MVLLPGGLHGAHRRADLSAYLGRPGLRRVLAEGRLATYSRSVLIDPRRAVDFPTRAAAALLNAGPNAVLTGQSALAVHGCAGADTAPVHLQVPYGCRPRSRPGVVVHHGRVETQDVRDFAGLPALALDMALAEVLCRSSRSTALACADEVLRMLPEFERAEFRAWVENRIATRADPRGRRRGCGLLNLATGLADSPAESRVLLALVDGDLPVPVQQYPVTDIDGRELYRLDFAWPEILVAVEYDGYEAHESRRAADAARDADLGRRGWIVVRAEAADLRDPSGLLVAVRAAFRRRGLTATRNSRF